MVDSGETTDTGFFRRIADIARRGDQRRGFVAWIRLRLVVGFLVAFPLVVTLFFGRFFIQWLASERARASVVPTAFWYFSLGGGLMLLTYALYRQDPVFILGQAGGLAIYLRNLYFLKRRNA